MKRLKFLFFDKFGPSARKVWAFFFCLYEVIDKGALIAAPSWHYSKVLHDCGVSDAVVITLIASMDAMALGALAVYGWSNGKAESPATPEPTAPAPKSPGDVAK